MDTSEIYIKMCEEAEEIQKLCQDKTGDYYFDSISQKVQIYIEEESYSYSITDKNYYNFDKDIWLPRQDQLQEMLNIKRPDDLISEFNEWTFNNNLYLGSIEQTLLAILMNNKYDKKWNGEDWIANA